MHVVYSDRVGGNNLYYLSGYDTSAFYGVRPVVYLRSDIIIEKLTSEEELILNEEDSALGKKEFIENQMQILESLKRIEASQKTIVQEIEKMKKLSNQKRS